MSDHEEEVARLARAREKADRSYNDALTALDRAIPPRVGLPNPPADVDDHRVQSLNDNWRLLPEGDIDLGTGWRRRLSGIAWRLVGPILQSQQRFNALLVEHLNRNIGGERESRRAAAAVITALDRHLKALALFQDRLLQYLQQITLFVDSKDRHEAGEVRRELGEVRRELGEVRRELGDVRRELADVRRLAEGLGTALGGVTDEIRGRLESVLALGDRIRVLEDETENRAKEQDGLSESVELVTAATHSMKREIERLRELPPTPPSTVAVDQRRATPTPDLDAYKYIAFENRFRGSRDDIIAAQRAYLPYFDTASDVLDLGCGRGEFLELMQEAGIVARGLDLNAEAVERCRELGLDATRGDALEHVRGLADESIGGLFSAQLVEHLDADYLTRLLAEAHRALRPGSHVVLETLNPACWTAFFSAFVRDITHRHPLHPDTLSFFLRASGFVDVEIVYRSPVPDAAKLPRASLDDAVAGETSAGAAVRALAETFNQHVDRLNGLIYAAQDYAAIARHP